MFARLALSAALATALAASALAEEPKPPPLEVGKAAPAFELPNHLGKPVKLASFAGKRWVLIAFYPKVATPG